MSLKADIQNGSVCRCILTIGPCTTTWNPFPQILIASCHPLHQSHSEFLEKDIKGLQLWIGGASPNPAFYICENRGSERASDLPTVT